MNTRPHWNNPPVSQKCPLQIILGLGGGRHEFLFPCQIPVLVGRNSIFFFCLNAELQESLNLTVTRLWWSGEGHQYTRTIFVQFSFPTQHSCIFYEVKNAEPTIQDRRQTRLLGWQRRVPRLHSGGLEQYSLGQLILLKQRPHLADRAAIFQPPGSCGASRGFSKGRRREIWAAVHNCGLGSLSWISEGLIILDWEVKWHWGVERVNRGSRQSVHQSCFGAFRHITTGTNGDQGLEWDHMTHRSRYRLVSLTALHQCSTKGELKTEKSVWNEALITKLYNNLHRL